MNTDKNPSLFSFFFFGPLDEYMLKIKKSTYSTSN